MPKHIARLIVLIVAFGALAYAAKVFFTVDSFYRYGHYRGDSVAQIASDKPKFKGSEYCKSCHAERYAQWSAGIHHSLERGKVVQCEVCHGAAGRRDVKGPFEHVSTGVDHPANGKLSVPSDSVKLCSLCHEKMPGRPDEQKQIDIATHAGSQQCTNCHNPHSPKLLRGPGTAGAQVANGPGGKAAACAGCHGADGVSTNPAWPSLAGQPAAYFVEALKAYKSGARDNAMMASVAKGMSEADMRELAGQFAALKIKGTGTAAGDPGFAAGKAKAAACAACHGVDGVSSNPAWPSLAGQQKDYIVAALKAYRDGGRKSDLMTDSAKGLSDADMDAIAGYYSRVRP